MFSLVWKWTWYCNIFDIYKHILTNTTILLLSVLFLNFYRFAFGPQHPASHGVLTCLLYLSNEYVVLSDMIIGYLHRGTEKLCETKKPNQNIPYFDRLDYVSIVFCEHMFVLSYEMLLSNFSCFYVSALRINLFEVTRIFNGLLCISCMLFDIGCMSPLLWCFEERCKILSFFEVLAGSRMHVAFLTIGGTITCAATSTTFLLFSTLSLLDLLELFANNNRICYLRLRGIGIFNFFDVSTLSISGVLARCTGLSYDLRVFNSYESYKFFSFCTWISFFGDSFDRMLLRLSDMRESVKLQASKVKTNKKQNFVGDTNIENLIYVFYILWGSLCCGLSFSAIESPKGEYNCILFVDSFGFSRVRIRCADYVHLMILEQTIRGYLLGDLVALIGNIDCVFGSIDR